MSNSAFTAGTSSPNASLTTQQTCYARSANRLDYPDVLVFAALLALSSAVGLYYAFADRRAQATPQGASASAT